MKGLSCQSSRTLSPGPRPKFTAHQAPIARNPVARSLRTQQCIPTPQPRDMSSNRCSTLSSHPRTRPAPSWDQLTVWAVTLPLEARSFEVLLRKEVIQPHLPVRLPCYDFVLIASPTFDSSLPQGVRPPASGVTDFHDVTGGVYKARERIHRSNADLRLLATPTSRGRVADPDPN